MFSFSYFCSKIDSFEKKIALHKSSLVHKHLHFGLCAWEIFSANFFLEPPKSWQSKSLYRKKQFHCIDFSLI